MRRPKEAPEYTEEDWDVGLDILVPADELADAVPAPREEVVMTDIAQHNSLSIGHFATVTVMTRDTRGHVHFLNGTM